MSPFYAGLVLGLIIGTCVGIVWISMLILSKEGDKAILKHLGPKK